MAWSIFDLFKVGIGPSSSHTVGPMKAAALFAGRLRAAGLQPRTARVEVRLYGSLGATGRGHGTDMAILLGLEGAQAEHIDPDAVAPRLAAIRLQGRLLLGGIAPVAFDEQRDLLFLAGQSLPRHPNGIRITAFDAAGAVLKQRCYYSVGGGTVLQDDGADPDSPLQDVAAPPLPFASGNELLAITRDMGLSIAQVVRRNELALRDDAAVDLGLDRIWAVMQACVEHGCATEGVLPGPMGIVRRAPALRRHLDARVEGAVAEPLVIMDWVNLYAMAVNEENAAGGRVVTAPTNGAAGIVPAVLHYYFRFVPGASTAGMRDFLLTAGAIGLLYRANASISGAEVGCQGEVGVACSMAAAGLAAALGGTPRHIENAAEIGMEHNLGLTCDPVGGRVQIPCIERNAMGAVKAINAARIALRGDGSHHVSLDQVIATMRETGRDMLTKYKETSLGGLAVNVTAC